ncbi:hypothetical protein L2X99_17510 [Microbacterium sp. KUDC0406]|uniref:hypothetical protein n=1 Tax=Microbacterium sp. KUDC0406 TaxID=2909588 RepID=UPI001F3D759A|nr:hypothetical protein [Microbacterium sp. KUDC0406]UJP10119.1 hypothetical protein L2X99_17510 [Microbacterium sp. KUDC0406]
MSMFHLAAVAVVLLLVAVILVFLWQLARGLFADDERTYRFVRRVASAAALVLLLSALGWVAADLIPVTVTMTVPMVNVWPTLPGAELEPSGATIESSGVALAELTLSGVSWPTRLLWAFGHLVSLLLPAAIAVLVALAARELERGAPFSPVLVRTTRASAVIVLVAGVAGPVAMGIAGSMASYQALFIRSASWTGYPDDWSPTEALPEATVFVPFEFWPIGVAIALFAFSAVLQHGRRLQKETEGLV